MYYGDIMITNLISFLYDMNIDCIRKDNNDYVFSYNDFFYIFKNVSISEENIAYLNNFINDSNKFHYLIKNRYGKYLSLFNNKYYVLMKVRFNINRLLLFDDISGDNKYVYSYMKRNDFSWINLWKNKIDQVEYFIDNNFVSVNDLCIINYYLSLSEQAINYFNEKVKNGFFPITLCHKRLKKSSDLYDYYCITDCVFDHYVRDIAEYVKNDLYQSKKIELSDYRNINNIEDKDLLISRLLFPSYFFDVFDDFVINKKDFKDFSSYFVDMYIYEDNLNKIIEYLLK